MAREGVGVEFISTLRLPQVVFGRGCSDDLAAIVRRFGPRALVIVRSPGFTETADWARLAGDLRQAGVEFEIEGVEGEPSPALVDAIVARRRGGSGAGSGAGATGVSGAGSGTGGAGAGAQGRGRESVFDCVVGIGGGSVMDTAKAVAGLLAGGETVMNHLEGLPPNLPFAGVAVPFLAVPTTAGTGSEATKNAVLSERGPAGFKRSFRDDALIARVAVVDPDLLATCPPPLIAANGMDALTQLLESYVSTRSQEVARRMAVVGIAAARDGFEAWYDEAVAGRGAGEAAAPGRERMALAALCSGICLAQTGLGAVHGVASPLGAQFPIPHGVACGATLAAATRVNIAALEAREPTSPALADYALLGRLLAGDLADPHKFGSDAQAREALIDYLDRLRAHVAMPGLAAFGITAASIPAVVADSRGSSMRTNPILLTDEEIAAILRASL